VLVTSEAAAWHHRHGGAVIIYGGPTYAPVYPYPYYAYPPPVYGVPAPAYVAPPPAYVSPPAPAYVSPPTQQPLAAPMPAAPSPAQRTGDCREYQTQITVAGKPQQAYGVTCRQPDGSWRIVTDAAPR
jgi:hypothetical protein